MGRRLFSGVFFAALLALVAWAAITGNLRRYAELPLRWLGIEGAQSETSDTRDVLFDDDSTVDFSDPVIEEPDDVPFVETETPIATPGEREFLLRPAYFDALLAQYCADLPLESPKATFSAGRIVLSGTVRASRLTSLFNIPSALSLFLPARAECSVSCVPRVRDGRIEVRVLDVRAGNDVISSFLRDDAVYSCVADFLNEKLLNTVPKQYEIRSVSVDESGIRVTFFTGN